MTSIITDYSERAKQVAIERGFREQTVLIREESRGEAAKPAIESEIMRDIRPYRFLVSGTWGMTND